jgi:hypothetical protein
METKTYSFIYTYRNETTVFWKQMLELEVIGDQLGFAQYFYQINGEWKRITGRKAGLKINKSSKGLYVNFLKKRVYLSEMTQK